MRSLLLLAVLAVSVSLAAAVPNAAVCNADAVQLELRPTNPGFYQLAFIAVDPRASNHKADFIDIHYRVNNEDSVNLRVLTEAAITDFNQRAKQASVDGIELEAGDVLRAYATYAANGIACDTPIHTFNAPESFSRMNQRMLFNQQSFDIAEEPTMRRRRVTMRPQTLEDEFWTQQAVEAEINHAQGACPAVAYDQDVLKMSGLRDSYVLSFENKTPGKQLNFVDLHVATDSSPEWNNLRLASDMQLDLAHKVMQPGVVVKPNERLSWYWSYRTTSADGITIDCTTPIQTITPQQITHEVDLNQIAQRI